MAGIAQGVNPATGYTDPPTAGAGIALGVTPARELLTADLTERELLESVALLLEGILQAIQLQNDLLFPDANLDNERAPDPSNS